LATFSSFKAIQVIAVIFIEASDVIPSITIRPPLVIETTPPVRFVAVGSGDSRILHFFNAIETITVVAIQTRDGAGSC